MEPPTLFELAEIDDDGGVAESASEVGVSVSRGAGASGGKERQHMSELLLQI